MRRASLLTLLLLLGFAGLAGAGSVTTSCDADASSNSCGDGGPATKARLAGPQGVAALRNGGFVIADSANNVVRRVSAKGTITRIAGIGTPGHQGDGGRATDAKLDFPTCVLEQSDGSILVHENGRIRRVKHGVITTVAKPDPCAAPDVLSSGERLSITNYQVLATSPANVVRVVAGTGECGPAGDGGDARRAQLANPLDVAVAADGGVLIADTDNNEIRRVSPQGGITTVAGRDPPILGCGASGEYATPNYLVVHGPVKAKAGKASSAGVTTTYPISYVVTLARDSKTVAKAVGTIKHGGAGKLKLPALKKRGTYVLTLVAKGVQKSLGGDKEPFTLIARGKVVVA